MNASPRLGRAPAVEFRSSTGIFSIDASANQQHHLRVFEALPRAIDVSRWVDRIDVVLPQWARDADSDTRARAHLFVAIISIAMIIAIISASFHVYYGATLRGLFSLAAIVPGLGTLLVLRRSDRLQPALHFFLSVIVATIVVSPYLSSAQFTVPIGASVVPFIAAVVAGLGPGLAWTFITLGVMCISAVLVAGDPAATHVAMNALMIAAICGFGSCILEAARIKADEAANKARLQASTEGQERARAQAALEASETLLAHSFREAPSMLILSELESGKIVDVNKSYERISGWTVDEVRGHTLTELDAWVSPEDRDRLAQVILSSGRTRDTEIQLKTKSGNVIWMLAAGSIVDLGGALHVIAQGIEITDRKTAELELARYRELLESRVDESSTQLRESRIALRKQQQLASIGTLAAGIAHQINNPIGSIMAAAEFALLDDQNGDPDSVQREALRNVVTEAERCGKIVRNVLRFARQEPTARWIEDLNPLVRRATELTSPYVIENGGRVVLNAETTACPARISPIEIEQVLVNVIRNAAESIEGQGEIRVSTRRREELIEIEISDEGRGMDAEQLSHVFDPFYTTRIEQGGTGLGLSFAHGVVVDHGGEIVVDSERGKGTRVRILLPRDLESNS